MKTKHDSSLFGIVKPVENRFYIREPYSVMGILYLGTETNPTIFDSKNPLQSAREKLNETINSAGPNFFLQSKTTLFNFDYLFAVMWGEESDVCVHFLEYTDVLNWKSDLKNSQIRFRNGRCLSESYYLTPEWLYGILEREVQIRKSYSSLDDYLSKSNGKEVKSKLQQFRERIDIYFQEGRNNEIVNLLNIGLKVLEENKPFTDGNLLVRKFAEKINTEYEKLVDSKRNMHIVNLRQAFMYVLREATDMTQETVGELFGGRDHTTVSHAEGKIKKILDR